ncbi:MAG: hypothetical protein HY906_26270 [Deltaproteobacteria bacterium]|nr:hypothetical protein [Deltaproteobacteria bacterium]
MPATREQVLEFLSRDWAAVRRAKDVGVARLIRRTGVRVAFELEAGLLALLPPRPAAAAAQARAADLAAHRALKEKLTRASARRRAAAR